MHSQSLQNTVFCLQQVLLPEVSLQHGLNLLGGSLIVQMFCCVPKREKQQFGEMKSTQYLHQVLQLRDAEPRARRSFLKELCLVIPASALLWFRSLSLPTTL